MIRKSARVFRRLLGRLRSIPAPAGGTGRSSEGALVNSVPPLLAAQPRVVGLNELMTPGDDKFVVFFAPEAGVVPHYITHCVVAKTLEDRGHRTLIVRCFDVYPRCVVMDGELLPLDLTMGQRQDVCNRCRHNADQMTGAYGLNVLDLQELIDDGIRSRVDTLMANLPEDLSSFEIDGVRLGSICGAEAAVTFKTTDFTGATPEVRRLMVWYLKGSLLSYFAMQRLLETGAVTRVVYFNEYAIVFAAALAARKGGVATTFMSLASIRGVDRRRLVLLSDPLAIMSYRNRLKEWPQWRDLCLPPQVLLDVVDDAMFRMNGNSIMVYSPTRSGATDAVFERLGLSGERKLLVAFTSSLDEIEANNQYLRALDCEPFSEVQPFANQIEWLKALIERVEQSKDLQLVVRVHPREGANRRESTVSSHLAKLRIHFDRPFDNVHFVWPGDNVSSYDLMELADVGLSGWSSTALEMARFGVPSAIAFDMHTPLPIGDVVQWAEKPDAYFRLIDEMLRQPPSLELIRFAFRWTYLRTLGSSFDLGDVILEPDCNLLPPFRTPAAGQDIESVLIGGETAIGANHNRMKAAQGAGVEAAEREALLTQLRRAIWLMCTGKAAPGDYHLGYRDEPTTELPRGCDAAVSRDGGFVEFRTRDLHVRRRSRMVQRLASLAANEPGGTLGRDESASFKPFTIAV